MLPESIIFDIDGTLWNSVPLVARGWSLGLREMGLPDTCTPESIQPLFGMTMTQIAAVIMPKLPEKQRLKNMTRLMECEDQVLEQDPCEVFYAGVKETLKILSQTHRLFIVSNCQKGYIEICMKKGGITDMILDHSCFGETGTCKGETIRRIMEKNRIKEATYVGDTQGDLEAAQYAGIPFVWASYGFGTPIQWDWKIDEFQDLLRL